MFVRNMVLRWTEACWQPKLFEARVHAQSTGRPVIDRLRMQQSGECQLVTRLTRELFVRARYVSAFCTSACVSFVCEFEGVRSLGRHV